MSARVIPDLLKPVSETLVEYRSDCVAFEHRYESLVIELDQLREQLASEARRIELRQKDNAVRDTRQIDDLHQRLADVQKERDYLRTQLDRSLNELYKVNDELRELRDLLQAQTSGGFETKVYRETMPIDRLEQLASCEANAEEN